MPASCRFISHLVLRVCVNDRGLGPARAARRTDDPTDSQGETLLGSRRGSIRGPLDAGLVAEVADLVGLDFRRGFKNKWDWGTHASVYHSYESKVVDYGFGLDVGFNVRDNLWVTIGYNVDGFHDSDFTAARYTAQGPYLQISMKADQHTLRNIAERR